MTTKVGNPFPVFLDRDGNPLDGGFIYIGTAGADPEVSPVSCYWDAALTIPASQPLRTRGGVIVNGSNPALVFVSPANYSLRSRDSDASEVSYVASVDASTASYQPLDSDLTAIAALSTTAYGRALLATPDAAGLRSYAGIVASLPLTGGTVTNNITRSGAGSHVYFGDATLTKGGIYITAKGAAAPTEADAGIWLERKV